jgi:FkbM family methyltransferase
LDLPIGLRFKLARQSALALLGWRGNVAVGLMQTPDGWKVRVDGREIAVASPLRWKLYRQGWTARLDRLDREYGVGRHVALAPGSVVVDIGANAGEFAFAATRRGASIYCVEPDPTAYACLAANLAALRAADAAARVSLADCVIWKDDGEIDFGLAPERADSSVFLRSGEVIRKRTMTLESFCRENSVGRIDLLKCDAEGAEPEALEGAGAILPSIKVVALDTGPERNGARTNAECAALLESAGFRVIEEKIGTRLMTYGINSRLG